MVQQFYVCVIGDYGDGVTVIDTYTQKDEAQLRALEVAVRRNGPVVVLCSIGTAFPQWTEHKSIEAKEA